MKFPSVVSSRERVLWIVLALALLALALVLLRSNAKHESELAQALLREKKLVEKAEETGRLLTVLREKQGPVPAQGPFQSYHKLYEWDLRRLRRKGLQDPINDLVNDLMKHPELIPYEGVLGGQMGFYSKRDIHVLSPKWVFAHFEDGHVSGHMWLEYQVLDGGKISWRVIDSYMLGGG